MKFKQAKYHQLTLNVLVSVPALPQSSLATSTASNKDSESFDSLIHCMKKFPRIDPLDVYQQLSQLQLAVSTGLARTTITKLFV